MNSLKFSIALMLLGAVSDAGAAVLRVNPDLFSLTPFHDPAAAIAAAQPGDTLYIEGIAGSGGADLLSPFPPVTVDKKLHFFGTGYFLSENVVYADGMAVPEFDALILTPSAAGTTLSGLSVRLLMVSGNPFTVAHCRIGRAMLNNCAFSAFRKNYFAAPPGQTALSLSGCFNLAFSNNFFGSASPPFQDQLIVESAASVNTIFSYNTFSDGTCSPGNSLLVNNIFYLTQLVNYAGSVFNNNLFSAGLNVPQGSITGFSNVFDANPFSFFAGATPAGDSQWLVSALSPALGIAEDGGQVGMFGGADPYILSGLDLPYLNFGVVPPCFVSGQAGCVTVSFVSPDAIAMNGGEYFIDTEPGPGNGTPFAVSGVSGTACFAVNTGGLANGFHRIVYRVRQSDGRWSHSRESDFQVKADDQVPNVTRIEFFIDDDPSFGAALAEFNPNDSPLSEITFTAPLAGLAPGPHCLSIRSSDANGGFSTTICRTIYVLPDEAPEPDIQQVEFFLDEDPGYGAGTVFPATGTTWEEEYNINLEGTSLGLHKLYVRMRDASGDIGTTQEKEIFVTVPGDLTQDFCVNVSDLILFLGLFGCVSEPGYYCDGDYAATPGASVVNVGDLLLLMSYFGTGNCSTEVEGM